MLGLTMYVILILILVFLPYSFFSSTCYADKTVQCVIKKVVLNYIAILQNKIIFNSGLWPQRMFFRSFSVLCKVQNSSKVNRRSQILHASHFAATLIHVYLKEAFMVLN